MPAAFYPGRSRSVILLLGLLALVANGYWWRLGRPVTLQDSSVKRIACVSYSPYRKSGQTPFDPHFIVSAAQIDVDLQTLSQRFDCVRTYSVSGGLEQVPAIARRYHMKVLLGIWLGRNRADNETEVTRGIALARQNRDIVPAVIVGNEVLLRGELSQSTLVDYIRRVRVATGLPVTYADVWEFWLRYREVAPAVSFVTIHILPYWEDDPVPIEEAVAHVEAIRQRMQTAFPHQSILIGETGWPSEGRQRRGAVPSRVNQARFMREFLNWADKSHINYNVIEAFDQPWKRGLEGTVGGYWGIYDDHLHEKFPLQGPVTEAPQWMRGILAGGVIGLAFLAVGWLCAARSAAAWVILALAGDGVGAALLAQWRYMGFANRTGAEWALTGGMTALSFITALMLAYRLSAWARPSEPSRAMSLIPGSRWPQIFARPRSWSEAMGLAQFIWLFALSVVDLLLVFDPRYRDFPIFLFAAPIFGFWLLAVARATEGRDRSEPAAGLEERFLSLGILVMSLLIVIIERPSNGSADLWSVMGVLLALSVLVRVRPRKSPRAVLGAHENERTDDHC